MFHKDSWVVDGGIVGDRHLEYLFLAKSALRILMCIYIYILYLYLYNFLTVTA